MSLKIKPGQLVFVLPDAEDDDQSVWLGIVRTRADKDCKSRPSTMLWVVDVLLHHLHTQKYQRDVAYQRIASDLIPVPESEHAQVLAVIENAVVSALYQTAPTNKQVLAHMVEQRQRHYFEAETQLKARSRKSKKAQK